MTEKCKECRKRLPPHTETSEFRDEAGRLQYHTHDMAKWMANLQGKVAPEQIVSWLQSERGSKRGLVFGYSYETGKLGYAGGGEYCSIACAATAAARKAEDAKAQPPDLSSADAMTGPRLALIRKNLRLRPHAFAIALGYKGSERSNEVVIRRLECGMRPIPPAKARVALLLERFAQR